MMEAVASMEMAPGQFPVPAGCRNRDFCPPKLVFAGGGASELFVDEGLLILGFSRQKAISRWKGEVGGRPEGPHHP